MPERQNSSSQLLTPSPADGDPLSFSPGGGHGGHGGGHGGLTRRISASALDVTASGIDRRRPSLSPAVPSPAIASPVVASPSAPVSTRTSPTKTHATLTPRPKRPSLDPDLLGIGGSGGRKYSSRRVSGNTRPRVALGLEGMDADDVLETRYDEMGDAELQAVLDRWAVKPLNLGAGVADDSSPSSSSEIDMDVDVHETPRSDRRRPPLEATPSPQHAHTGSPLAPKLTRSSSSNQPLFPPSPPQAPKSSEHPLRVLSKAVRELMASVSRLEAENETLRDTVAEQAAQISRLAQANAPLQAMASRPRSIKDSGERERSEAVSVPKSDQVCLPSCSVEMRADPPGVDPRQPRRCS